MSTPEELLTILQHVTKKLRRQGFNVGDSKSGLTAFSNLTGEQLASYHSWFIQNPTPVQQLIIEGKNTQLRSLLSQIVERVDSDSKVIERAIIYFVPMGQKKKVPKRQIEFFARFLEPQTFACNTGILISGADLSPSARAHLDEIRVLPDYHIEIYRDEDLFYDPLESEWVPRGLKILSESEARKLWSEDRVHPSRMPRIRTLDPVAMRLGLRSGQILQEVNHSWLPGMMVDREEFLRLAYFRAAEKRR